MEWQTFLGYRLEVVGLNNLTRLVFDAKLGAVKVCDHKVDASQGLNESDFVFNEQVSSLSLELLVGLLLHDNYNVTSLLAWELISFTVERVLLIVGCTLVHHGVENFLLLDNLLALASLALVGLVDNLTLATAVVTRTLGLGVHARSELGHARHHTTATAGCALLDSAIFTSFAFAASANALSIHGNLGLLAIVNLLERALKWVHDGLALLGASGATASTATSEEAAKKVVHATGVTTTLFDTVFAVLVVELTLLAVAQHLVS